MVADFCFPNGVLDFDDDAGGATWSHTFVFTGGADAATTGNSTYGLCVTAVERVNIGDRFVWLPRCYCVMSRYPFFSLLAPLAKMCARMARAGVAARRERPAPLEYALPRCAVELLARVHAAKLPAPGERISFHAPPPCRDLVFSRMAGFEEDARPMCARLRACGAAAGA